MYVVIGATDNTGSVVAEGPLAERQKVRAVGRTDDRLQYLADLGAEPFVAEIAEAGAVAGAFAGAQAAYVMIPPKMGRQEILAHDRRVADALASAIEKGAVNQVVALSNIGADNKEKTDSVAALNISRKSWAALLG
jgi:uncharacterized protein YbjT (DUF2867 family)